MPAGVARGARVAVQQPARTACQRRAEAKTMMPAHNLLPPLALLACAVLLQTVSVGGVDEAGTAADDSEVSAKRVDGSNGKIYMPDLARLEQMNLYTEAAVRNDVDKMLGTYLRCEACQAVAFQLMIEFTLAEKYSKNAMGSLPESMVEMVANEEGACSPDHFEEHHLRNVNETRYLVGMGMPLGVDTVDGVKITGNITVPLAIRCVDIMRAVGIQTIYEAYVSKTLEHTVCLEETQSCKPPAEFGAKSKRKRKKKGKKGKRQLAEEEPEGSSSGGSTSHASTAAQEGEAAAAAPPQPQASDRWASTRPAFANELIALRAELQLLLGRAKQTKSDEKHGQPLPSLAATMASLNETLHALTHRLNEAAAARKRWAIARLRAQQHLTLGAGEMEAAARGVVTEVRLLLGPHYTSTLATTTTAATDDTEQAEEATASVSGEL